MRLQKKISDKMFEELILLKSQLNACAINAIYA